MSTTLRPHAVSSRPMYGTGRLGIISAYFTWCGVGAGLQTAALIVATVFPRALSLPTQRPLLMLGAAALMTFSFFRTSHLLDQRRRSGATLAGLCFLASLPSLFTGSKPGLIGLGVSIIGLGLIASVWKYLEKD